MKVKFTVLLTLMLIISGCGTQGDSVAQIPTDTLAPLVSLTPRFTATIAVTRTPLPSFTPTPSITPIPPTPSNTFTPTEIPPVYGIISSMQQVNVREGPGIDASAFAALDAGTRVEVLGQNANGSWLNIKLEDGREGWANATLVRVEPSPTPFPSTTPQPDTTALSNGTPLPTALIGGGTITPTAPQLALNVTSTEEVEGDETEGASTTPTESAASPTGVAPAVINTTGVFQTVTALAAGVTGSQTPQGQVTAVAIGATSTLPVAGIPTATPGTPAPTTVGGASVQTSVNVLAYCNNPAFGSPPPRNLAAGSRINVFWGWYARTREQLQSHRDNVIYEVRVNGDLIENWEQYATNVREEDDGNYHVYWYVPTDPLPAGQVNITYRVTWSEAITDGYAEFGPGTARPSEEGTCTFTVQ